MPQSARRMLAVVRSLLALAMVMLAGYAVATLQWWALVPAALALLLEPAAARRSS